MASTTPFLSAVATRRSVYALAKDSPIPNERIIEIVNEALKHAPSPFNMRSARCIVLFGDEHNKLWQTAYKITAEATPGAMGTLGPKIQGFESAYGTCLFFDDLEAYNSLTPRFSAISKSYPEWEEHSSGMHQFVVWTALTAEGLGCSLQHYHPSITPYVEKTYGVPASWKLKCQMPFGTPIGEMPGPKPKTYLNEALKVYGA
ncbi:Nitroreductase [Amniculicola lignicola CBS 123094]|uniref:Nitroreductase n=1 Tax=Amniculicola lignicola CBS 123094 TaxID=1392246 RepID=A0A6A5X2X0_9PLEO|nr:Nitroreductase [Amniculicola lignicola CBS 123094]